MTIDEFVMEIKKLEAALSVPIARSAEEIEFRDLRRVAIFEVIESFPIAIFREARKRLCMPTAERAKYFPPAAEIVQACEEVLEEARKSNAEVLLKTKFQPAEHRCSAEKPKQCEALNWLATFRYEAQHITCKEKIPATCPMCGKRYEVADAHRPLMEKFPQDTKNWNPCFKGLMLCSNCSKKQNG